MGQYHVEREGPCESSRSRSYERETSERREVVCEERRARRRRARGAQERDPNVRASVSFCAFVYMRCTCVHVGACLTLRLSENACASA